MRDGPSSCQLWAIDPHGGQGLVRVGDTWCLISAASRWTPVPLAGAHEALRWARQIGALAVDAAEMPLDAAATKIRETFLGAHPQPTTTLQEVEALFLPELLDEPGTQEARQRYLGIESAFLDRIYLFFKEEGLTRDEAAEATAKTFFNLRHRLFSRSVSVTDTVLVAQQTLRTLRELLPSRGVPRPHLTNLVRFPEPQRSPVAWQNRLRESPRLALRCLYLRLARNLNTLEIAAVLRIAGPRVQELLDEAREELLFDEQSPIDLWNLWTEAGAPNQLLDAIAQLLAENLPRGNST